MNDEPTGLHGLNIALLAGSQPEAIADAVRFHGGTPICFFFDTTDTTHPESIANFANRLLTADIDYVVFATGVGVSYVVEQASRRVDRQRFLDCLSDITTISGSTQATEALAAVGIEATIAVKPVQSWRNIMMAIDQHAMVTNQTVGLEETAAFVELAANLEARGARITRIPVFPQTLPPDPKPATDFFERINAGEFHAVLIASAQAAVQFCFLAKHLGRTRFTNHILDNHLVLTLGAGAKEILQDQGINPDFSTRETDSQLAMAEISKNVGPIQAQKSIIRIHLSGPRTSNSDPNAPWHDSLFMRACRGESTDTTPIWMMGQSEFFIDSLAAHWDQTSRRENSLNPELGSKATCMAVNRLGVDAAVVFLDPLAILAPMTGDPDFNHLTTHPIRDANDLDRIRPLLSTDPLASALDTVRQSRNDLPADIPLIGFSLAPFTLASHLIDGAGSRDFRYSKSLMIRDPTAWSQLMQNLSNSISLYLNGQIESGAQCIQLFDPRAGCLSFDDYRKYVLPYVSSLIASLPANVPVINSAIGNPALLPLLADTQATVIGVGGKTRIDSAWQIIGDDRAIQGNLDPVVLLTGSEAIQSRAGAVLDQTKGRAGHIFNLGSEILSGTTIENLIELVNFVHG